MQSFTSWVRHSRISGVYLVLSSLWPKVKLVFDPQVNSSSWWSVGMDIVKHLLVWVNKKMKEIIILFILQSWTKLLEKNNVFINAHYLTQQNYFQINGFAQRIPPPPIQSCFLQMLRDPAFFWRPNNTASRGRGGRKESVGYKVQKKCPPNMQFSQQFCPRLLLPLSCSSVQQDCH